MDSPAQRPPAPARDPAIEFPAELPISARVPDLAAAIAKHQVVVVTGETGSGKTTQLPKLCLAMGRGQTGQIGCTQPRRLAATSVAARIAQELGSQVGEIVGYKVRFGDSVRRTSRIKLMTDGILLAEIQSDPRLRGYDTIIIDEAHERSVNIDFLLGYLSRLAPRRPELRIIISSATLETERFAEFFGGAPIVSVSGRTFPVDVLYRPPNEEEGDLADAVANTVNEIVEMDPRGDILVFLPGEREIREAMGELERRALPRTEILPLYSRLSGAEQQRVFSRGGLRRVILATNVAETSLTIPGIIYVVDSGLGRVNRYNVRTGVSQLLTEPVSRASADQRKGRCGRTANGVCFRLYEESDYEARPTHTDPEILRVNLAAVILRMKALRLGEIDDFPFLDPPGRRAVTEGLRVLEELGAIDEEGRLLPLGTQLAKLPIDPRLGRMILAARDEGALREVVVIAAVLGLPDPRERPLAAQQRADEAHRQFRDEGSDFAGFLKLWAFWREAQGRTTRNGLRKLCRDTFLSYQRMREWEDIYDQLVRVMRELGFAPNTAPAQAENLHRALLPGLLSKIGMWNQEARVYIGARQTRFVIHPSSGLARKPPAWIMAAELVETSQLFARTVAKIDPAWLERAAGSLCRKSHGDPHWEQKQAQVVAKEQVSLFGLPIVRDRRAPYDKHDPALCRRLFITHALVRGEYQTRGTFSAHNHRLFEEVHRLRDKARRSDMLADELELELFFDKRLPDTVTSGKTFEAWRERAEAEDPHVLHLSRADLLLEESAELTPERYPDELAIGGVALPLRYKFEPGQDDDGVTMTIPLAVLPQLSPEVMQWTIPGWHAAKIDALLDSLPKAVRRRLGAQDELVAVLAKAVPPFSGPMLPALTRAIYERTGERLALESWELGALPPHLSFTFRVVDEHDKELGVDKDLAELARKLGARASALWAAAPRSRFERKALTTWDFDELPRQVTLDIGGRRLAAYPALVDAETSVELRLLESADAADAATREGLRRLYLLALGTPLAKLEAQLPGVLAQQGPLAVTGWPTTPRRQLALRALDETFGLLDPSRTPRTRAEFNARVTEGRRELPLALARLGKLGAEIAAELDKVSRALRPLGGKPGPLRAALDDITSQLAHLVPPELLATATAARLGHLQRYLRALQIRIGRLAIDPQKDQSKASAIAPLWKSYLARREALLARGGPTTHLSELDDLAQLFEELRISIFAPEVGTAIPISEKRVREVAARHGIP